MQIDAPRLVELALETIIPKLRKFGGEFIWCVEEFVIRDAAWVDLSGHPQSVPYFYDQCLQPSCKGNKSIFKSKQFALMVVVPEVQWSEYENWLELRAEMVHILSSSCLLTTTNHDFAVQQAKATRTSHTQSSEHAAADTAISRNVPSSKSATTSLAENELNELFLPSMTTNNSVMVSTKRTHQCAESSSGLSGASSPPRKKNIPPTALCSPDRDRLKEVLKIAGSANLNVKKGTYIHQFLKLCQWRPLTIILQFLDYRTKTFNSTTSLPVPLPISCKTHSIIHFQWTQLSRPLDS